MLFEEVRACRAEDENNFVQIFSESGGKTHQKTNESTTNYAQRRLRGKNYMLQEAIITGDEWNTKFRARFSCLSFEQSFI